MAHPLSLITATFINAAQVSKKKKNPFHVAHFKALSLYRHIYYSLQNKGS